MNKTEFLIRFPWLMTFLVISAAVAGHIFYNQMTEWAIKINMSGSEGQFYVDHPSLCAYDWSPNPLSCYLLQGDLMTTMIFMIIGLVFYSTLFRRIF